MAIGLFLAKVCFLMRCIYSREPGENPRWTIRAGVSISSS